LSYGQNLLLEKSFAAAASKQGPGGCPVASATHSGDDGHTVLTALWLQLAHLGAHVVGRLLVSTKLNLPRTNPSLI
jgi:hypothetical protein